MKNCFVIVLILFGFGSRGQTPELDCLNIPDKHETIVGLRSNQIAKPITSKENFERNTFSLYADPSAIDKYDYLIRGFKLYIINDTDSIIHLSCQGRNFDIICEAQTASGEWKEIETNQSSWCGNLYSEMQLNAHQYFTVPVACYSGVLTTKLRYKMRAWGKMYAYSNEIVGQINPGQLE